MGASYEDAESKTMFQMSRLASESAASTAQDRDRDRADRGLLDPELNDHDNHDRHGNGRHDDLHDRDNDQQDETTRALIDMVGRDYRRPKRTIWIVYSYANLCAILRTIYCLPLAGLAAYMLAPGSAQYQTILPYAALTLAVAVIHILLASHRTMSPASSTSALPSRLYLSALVVSPVLLLASLAYGAAVLHLTKQYYDQKEDHVVRCGRRSRRKWLCSVAQCWYIYTLNRNRYSATEIAQATDVLSPATFTSVMKDAFKGWGWGKKK
ncbi:hypothetical protein C8A05DRAFT_32306 [Staphylotrichum tortipilum]|uniref:Uncharacterized protein n=1 Tax=Staphylotrichum tortipilum TaxID=2831512 RepID=A0AAN6RV64_9PEZI|nr:hypothetical protein C8A05DRAFT_32306 [Staphylotrichum longicolle]